MTAVVERAPASSMNKAGVGVVSSGMVKKCVSPNPPQRPHQTLGRSASSPRTRQVERAMTCFSFTSTLPWLVLLGLGLHGTHAMAIEEPKFETLSKHGAIELRRYAPFIVAETFVEGDLDDASGAGFRAIADYIFGNNVAVNPTAPDKTAEKIAMTVPVTMAPAPESRKPAPQKVAMTAPVTMEPLPTDAPAAPAQAPAMQGAKRWRMHFVMPSVYTLATLPKPNNPEVQLRQVPAKTWAVLRYSGFNTEAGTQKRTDELATWLAQRNIQTLGSPQLARYNPPLMPPMFRRNEIMWEIAP
jgi:SOUL heme-binding protein